MLSLRLFILSFCMSPCSSEHIFSRLGEPGFRGEVHPFGSPCSFDLLCPWPCGYMQSLVRDCLMAGESMRVSPFIPVCVQELLPVGPSFYIALVKKLIEPERIVENGLSMSGRDMAQPRLFPHPPSQTGLATFMASGFPLSNQT